MDTQADFKFLINMFICKYEQHQSVSEDILAVFWDSGLTTDGLVIADTIFILM